MFHEMLRDLPLCPICSIAQFESGEKIILDDWFYFLRSSQKIVITKNKPIISERTRLTKQVGFQQRKSKHLNAPDALSKSSNDRPFL